MSIILYKMFVTSAACTVRVGPVWGIIVLTTINVQFYLTHWEEYFTGVLLMGKWDGPTEGQVFAMAFQCFAGVLALTGNGDFFEREALGLKYSLWTTFVFIANNLISITKLLMRAMKHMKDKGGSQSIFESILVLSSFSSFTVLYLIWFYTSYGHMSVAEMRMLFNSVGFMFGYLTSRLIVQRICKEPYVLFYPSLIPLVAIVFNNILFLNGFLFPL